MIIINFNQSISKIVSMMKTSFLIYLPHVACDPTSDSGDVPLSQLLDQLPFGEAVLVEAVSGHLCHISAHLCHVSAHLCHVSAHFCHVSAHL